MACNATVRTGEHTYTSNRAITTFKHDAIIGMPWHQQLNPKLDYQHRTVQMGELRLSVLAMKCKIIEILKMSVEKFRSLLSKKPKAKGFEIYYAIQTMKARCIDMDTSEHAEDTGDL